MKIRTALPLAVATITVFLVYVSGSALRDAELEHQAASDFQTVNRTAERLLEAAGTWAIERGMTNGALAAPDPAPADLRDDIAARRAAADTAFATALERLRDQPTLAASIADATARFDRLRTMRVAADAALARAKADRAADTLRDWMPTATANITAVQQLRLGLEAQASTAHDMLAQLVFVRHLASELAEYAGRERATVTALLASGQPITLDQVRTLAALRARVELAWDMIQAARQRIDLPAAIRAAIDTAERRYFGDYTALRERILAAGATARYPLDARAYFERATAAIDSILTVSQATTAGAHAIAETTSRDSAWRLIVNAAIFAVGLVVGIASLVFALRRVAGAITRITATMSRLAGGDLAVEIPGRERSDEIGEMAQSIQIFKDKMAAELSERAKSVFLTAMSHELRTPIAVIIGSLDMVIAEELGPLNLEDYGADLVRSREQATALLAMIDNILEIADLGRQVTVDLDGRVDLDALLDRAVTRARSAVAAHPALRIERRGDTPPPLRGDERRVAQILDCLLSNAVKFSPAGGAIAVTATVTPDSWLEIAVSDQGIGMTAAEARRAVDAFVQIDEGTTRRFGGVGVGLTIAKALTELHDGRLEIASEPGRGTTVQLRFPWRRVVGGAERHPLRSARREPQRSDSAIPNR